MKYCVNCTSYNVCKYADKRRPDLCRYYLFRSRALKGIMLEVERQNEKWGEQNHPMTKSKDMYVVYKRLANKTKADNFVSNQQGDIAWHTILLEEVYEAFAETDPEKQREEMVQVAAVAVQIIECLDRKRETKDERQ
jgi:hypothetical protein